MNSTTQRYQDREIINRWAVTEINPAISDILLERGLSQPDADSCIGYFYVDHDDGIIFRIHSLCRTHPDALPEILHHFENHGEGLILFSECVGPFRLLSGNDLPDLSIDEEQRWMVYYDPESLHTIRIRVDLDRFRAPDFFDDVSVILLSNDEKIDSEVVWVRLNNQSADGTSFEGTLLNEPYSDFGLHEGDELMVRLDEDEGGRFLVAGTRVG